MNTTSIRAAFTSWPHCVATYVCLIGAAWLLAFGWKPDRSRDPVPVVSEKAGHDARVFAEASGGRVFWVNHTGSMKPLLLGGEFVVVVSRWPARPGDVIGYWPTFRTETGNPLVHRVAAEDKDGLILSGDSAPHTESWARVTRDNYIGTVVAIYRPATKAD